MVLLTVSGTLIVGADIKYLIVLPSLSSASGLSGGGFAASYVGMMTAWPWLQYQIQTN